MAVAKLEKYLIVVHKSEETKVLKYLQKNELVELKPYFKKETETEENPQSLQKQDLVLPAVNIKAKRALDILTEYKKKPGKKIASRAGKLIVSNHEYENIISRTDNEEIIEEIISIDREINFNNARISELSQKINQFDLWSSFKGRLELLGDYDSYSIKLGTIKARKNVFEEICSEFEKRNISYEIINSSLDLYYVIIAYHSGIRSDAQDYLSEIPFEEADIEGCCGTIQENIDALRKQLDHLESKNNNLVKKLQGYSKDFERNITIYLDYLENNVEIEWALNYGYSTDNVSFYTAWVKKDDKKTLNSLISNFNFTRIVQVEPEEDEVIPTILENKKIFRPFEFIINLYGIPRYFEIDPTPYMAVFFALFFGLCLTDAGYGFIFVALSIVLFFKMKGSKNIPLLVLILGIFTILGGAVFNGWFGDLPSYLGVDDFFARFAILGDPMKSTDGAMNFFRLALLLGVIQVIFGLVIKFFDNLFRKEYKIVFFDTLPWIVIIVSLIIMLLSTEMAVSIQLVSEPVFPASVSKILIWLMLPAALVIILFGARDEKKWGLRLFMGFLNLTIVNGITSFLGDFLSYIRLMALGLVTAGIGTAINKIAFQLGSIPVIGIVIVIICLIFGHIFNIGINILGGFVHTMRLQYVEFFSKFYVGGGKPFEVLKEEHKYISIKD
ncbi:MAG TPA: hypothetical protein DCY00_02505 [Actinobacteria bacterium]|nr:hypothetical protein [Actinomycetota bacterium]